ncbi:hypothetical protein QFZ54_000345 [Sphingomonas faeni]|nr:hypothetical protein [Sphingomonas faeni]
MAFKNSEAAFTAVAVSFDTVALIPARAMSAQNHLRWLSISCRGLRT